jgi:hypothetical protein
MCCFDYAFFCDVVVHLEQIEINLFVFFVLPNLSTILMTEIRATNPQGREISNLLSTGAKCMDEFTSCTLLNISYQKLV